MWGERRSRLISLAGFVWICIYVGIIHVKMQTLAEKDFDSLYKMPTSPHSKATKHAVWLSIPEVSVSLFVFFLSPLWRLNLRTHLQSLDPEPWMACQDIHFNLRPLKLNNMNVWDTHEQLWSLPLLCLNDHIQFLYFLCKRWVGNRVYMTDNSVWIRQCYAATCRATHIITWLPEK